MGVSAFYQTWYNLRMIGIDFAETSREELPFRVGDTVKVHKIVREGTESRTQIFSGIILSIRGEKANKMMIVRRIGAGHIGVEQIFPLVSPSISKISVTRRGHVRRAKLYYLRKEIGKKATTVKRVTA